MISQSCDAVGNLTKNKWTKLAMTALPALIMKLGANDDVKKKVPFLEQPMTLATSLMKSLNHYLDSLVECGYPEIHKGSHSIEEIMMY